MGLYKSTNEMFNNSTLYHSDTYLGNDYTDGIKHWKYIKREKRNGRWIYYYKDDKYDKLRNKSSNAHIDSNIALNKYYDAKKKYDSLNGPTSVNKYKKAMNDKVSAAEKANKARRKSEIADERFDKYAKKTAIRRLSGQTLVKALNTSSKIVYKGKNKVNKLLKKLRIK